MLSKYQTTCAMRCGKNLFISTMKQDNQLIKGPVLKTKQYDMIIWPPPFWDYNTWWFKYNNLLGIYAVVHYDNKIHGQSGSRVSRFPGSGILVPCGHGQIFVAAQVWHGMSQALVPGHSSEQLVWWEQLGPVSSGLPVLQVQQMQAACVVQVGVVQVVPLKSGVLSEPAVCQLCHLGQCQLLWHCVLRGVSVHGSMWNHCWCILDSCSMVGCVSQ